MVSMYYPLFALSTCLFASAVHADVTIYGLLGQTTAAPVQTGTATGTTQQSATTSFVTTHGPPQYTELAAYNNIYMEPPAIPNPPPANQFAIGVPTDATLMNGLSIKQSGTFFGFSIEMSVVNQLSECSIHSRVSQQRRQVAHEAKHVALLRYFSRI